MANSAVDEVDTAANRILEADVGPVEFTPSPESRRNAHHAMVTIGMLIPNLWRKREQELGEVLERTRESKKPTPG